MTINASAIQHVDPLPPFNLDAMIEPGVYGAAPFVKEYCVMEASALRYIGPDDCEMNAQVFTFAAEAIQARRMAPSATPVMAVPAGLSPIEHFNAGVYAESPLEQECMVLIIELNHKA